MAWWMGTSTSLPRRLVKLGGLIGRTKVAGLITVPSGCSVLLEESIPLNSNDMLGSSPARAAAPRQRRTPVCPNTTATPSLRATKTFGPVPTRIYCADYKCAHSTVVDASR